MINSPFVNQGFKNWKKAVGVKDGYLDRHANSAGHISSSERIFGVLHCIQNSGTDIHAKIDNSAAEVQIRTKKGIRSIIDVVIALGQRGNWSGDEQAEDGNYAFFVDWKAKNDSDLADHLRFARKAAKYTSPQIQNEIISLCERERYDTILYLLFFSTGAY